MRTFEVSSTWNSLFFKFLNHLRCLLKIVEKEIHIRSFKISESIKLIHKMFQTDASSALAIDGPTWDDLIEYFPGLVPQVATRSLVFARMSPQQKANVVETLQSLDYIVAMVGDGANDCGVSDGNRPYSNGSWKLLISPRDGNSQNLQWWRKFLSWRSY